MEAGTGVTVNSSYPFTYDLREEWFGLDVHESLWTMMSAFLYSRDLQAIPLAGRLPDTPAAGPAP